MASTALATTHIRVSVVGASNSITSADRVCLSDFNDDQWALYYHLKRTKATIQCDFVECH